MHIYDNYRQEAIDFYNELIENYNLGEWLTEVINAKSNPNIYVSAFHRWFQDQHKPIPDELIINSGCTRTTITDCELDFVLKIQYRDLDGIDYGRTELETYQEAEARGCADAFAWCMHLTDFVTNGGAISIYVMEKVDVDVAELEGTISDCLFKDYCEAECIDINNVDIEQVYNDFSDTYMDDFGESDAVLEYAHCIFSPELFHSMMTLLDDFGIGDLHSGNWGYRIGDRHLVVIDYAGYGMQCGLEYFERYGGN